MKSAKIEFVKAMDIILSITLTTFFLDYSRLFHIFALKITKI